MRRIFVPFVLLLTSVACADAPPGPASGGTGTPEPTPTETPSPVDTLRVDLVEAGLRAVLPSDGGRDVLFVMTELCRSTMMDDERECEGSLTEEEQAILADRLAGVADEIRFYPSYEDIPEGEAPIDRPGGVVAWVGPPEERPDGHYWIEAGETCGGLCGHGSIYVLELRGERWVSTGTAPGAGGWIS